MRLFPPLPLAPVAAALVGIAAVLAGCTRTAEAPLPALVTATVLPAADAPSDPVGAGPVTTDPVAANRPLPTVVATLSYTVQVGDTVSGIAEQFGTSFEVLVMLNNLKEPGRLGVGQVLAVPVPPATTAPPPTPPAQTPGPGSTPAAGPQPTTEGSATTLPPATKEG